MTLIFFLGGGGGLKRWDGKLCVPTEKSWLRPCIRRHNKASCILTHLWSPLNLLLILNTAQEFSIIKNSWSHVHNCRFIEYYSKSHFNYVTHTCYQKENTKKANHQYIPTWRWAPFLCATKRNALLIIFRFSGSKSWNCYKNTPIKMVASRLDSVFGFWYLGT